MKSSGIGGQAVIEGVMMKNKDHYAVAVRTPENEIVVEKKEFKSFSEKHRWAKIPFVRGVVTFVESMQIGMQTLTYSASFYEEEEQQKESKFEKALSNVFKEKAESVIMGITVVIAMVIAVGIFMVLPWLVTEWAGKLIDNPWLQALIEGLLRLVIFIVYVAGISLTKDIRRVYMYHGAEHKVINCVENGYELTVQNVKRQSREHKRCGTSFLLYVMVISILFFMFIRVDQAILRIVLRLVLIPVVAGVSYEFIRLAGNSDSKIMDLLSRPGMWMQNLTTREPDEDMIEVAIRSVEAVFDWRAYLAEQLENEKNKSSMVDLKLPEEEEEETTSEVPQKRDEEPHLVAAVKKADHSLRRGGYFREDIKVRESSLAEENKNDISGLDKTFEFTESDVTEEETNTNEMPRVASLKKANRVRRPLQPIEELRRDRILEDAESDDDEDEILSALDKFFE